MEQLNQLEIQVLKICKKL